MKAVEVPALDVPGLDAGAAWFEEADGVVQGRVRAMFGRACYLGLGDRLLALCRADVPSGPLHLRIPALPTLRIGDPVLLGPGRLEAGSWAIGFGADRRWSPEPVAAAELTRRAGRHHGVDDRSSTALRTGLTGILDQASGLVVGHDLVNLARLVGGRGPGLTPAGDDLLAGVLVVDALVHPGQVAVRRAAVQAVATTDVAAAFLQWAALGQCIEPFHDVVSAIAAGHPDREVTARATLRTTGASSGEALLLGLDLALWAARARLIV